MTFPILLQKLFDEGGGGNKLRQDIIPPSISKTTDELNNFTGIAGEITYDSTTKRLVTHDGSTKGGIPLAKVSEINDVQTSLNNTKSELETTINQVIATAGDAKQEDILEAANKAGTAQINAEPDSLQEILTRIATLEANLGTQIAALEREFDSRVHIVETYVSGLNGWRLYSDGYIEQWGRTSSSGRATTTVTLHKEMADLNYNITVCQNAASDTWSTNADPLSTTQIKLYNDYGPGSWWRVCGQAKV